MFFPESNAIGNAERILIFGVSVFSGFSVTSRLISLVEGNLIKKQSSS